MSNLHKEIGLLRAAAEIFGVPGDAIVKVKREGGKEVSIRLEDLLRRMERKAAKDELEP
jgi:hypothetical protein